MTKAIRAHNFLRMNVQRPIPKKKAVNLSIDAELLKESKDAGLNLSKVLEEELRRLRVEAWKRENADAIKQAECLHR